MGGRGWRWWRWRCLLFGIPEVEAAFVCFVSLRAKGFELELQLELAWFCFALLLFHGMAFGKGGGVFEREVMGWMDGRTVGGGLY